jgi:excisionase family DNA binding protein
MSSSLFINQAKKTNERFERFTINSYCRVCQAQPDNRPFLDYWLFDLDENSRLRNPPDCGRIMRTANLTTKHAARLLNVSEATVKRWADDGVLTSKKTVGGHRRFGIESIAQLRRERSLQGGAPHVAKVVKKKTKPLPAADDFLRVILAGDELEAAAALVDAYLAHHSLDSIFETIVTQAMHKVGDLWLKGSVTVADEHLATRVVLTALQKLRDVIVPHEPNGLSAICCGSEGDLHELAVHLVTLILESRGWNVIDLGANTPLFSLQDMVSRQRPQLVCISARTIADLDRATAEFAQLRRVANRLKAKIVLGGEAFRDPNMRTRFPADFFPANFPALSRVATKLAKETEDTVQSRERVEKERQ